MKITAIQSSPRQDANTAILLQSLLDRAKNDGADTELIHLNALDFRGCRSCLICKLNESPMLQNSECFMMDGLSSVLSKVKESDILLVASPVYFGNLSADCYAFLERLFFSANVYDENRSSLFPKRLPTGYILTMNRDFIGDYEAMLNRIMFFHDRIIGPCESLMITDTCQFDDYSKYYAPVFDAEHKKQQRERLITEEVNKAYEMLNKLISYT